MSDLEIDKDGELNGAAVAQLDRSLRGLDGMLCLEFCTKLVAALAKDGIVAKVAVEYAEAESTAYRHPFYKISAAVGDKVVAGIEESPAVHVAHWHASVKHKVNNER